MKNSRFNLLPLWLLGVALLTGCVSVPPTQPAATEWSAQRYYTEARQAQTSGDYSAALTHLTELKRRYPESPYAALAPMETAFAHYQRGEHPFALQAVDQFISQQPQPAGLDYAWYLKGLIQTKLATPPESNDGVTEIIPELGRDAYRSFAHLAKHFPDSQYRPEALQQIEQLRNQLTSHEFKIVQTLLQQGDQQDALERANYLIKNYPDTRAASETQNLIQDVSPVANSAIHSETWLLQQNPSHYTIQIVGTGSKPWLNGFIAKHQLQEKIAYYRSESRGEAWYTLLYGIYANQDEATAAMSELKARLKLDDAWLRQLEVIQNTIRSVETGH